jgi:2-polyprenyl-6-methoxyphenol hydroxylase-like FAD-dependent oxidoreductase
MARIVDVPVLVVGAGLVGSILALELARNGVPCTVVDRSTSPTPHPRTDYLNARTMELLRRLGISGVIREHGAGPDCSTDVAWTRSLCDQPILVWHHPSVNQTRHKFATVNDGTAPVEPHQRIAGPTLVKLTREMMRQSKLIDFREGWEVNGLSLVADEVRAVVERNTDGTTHTVRARYAVACDGAGSTVRQVLGIPLKDLGPNRELWSVHFRSQELSERHLAGTHMTIAADDLTLVSHDDNNEWTASMPALPDRSSPTDPIAVLQKRLNTSFAVDRHLGHTRCVASLAVSAAFSEGPVYLAGDCAHEFYPGDGYGENTGIADALNLGWKLAASINQWGGPKLLDSYEEERRPVALFVGELSANFQEVSRRFARLSAAGTPREHLAGILERDIQHLDDLGVQFGHRYEASSVVWHEKGDAPIWDWHCITPTTFPGTRAPAVRTSDGRQLFDQFGPVFTLVDLSGNGLGEPLVKEAARRNIPIEHLCLDDNAVRACWEKDLVLVRPDHYVAWRDDVLSDDAAAILDRVTGA